MTRYEEVRSSLAASPKVWLVTGVAGFIGSNLLQTLLELGQTVRGLDDFSTGKTKNLDEVKAAVSAAQWAKFTFLDGDIRNPKNCQNACQGVDYVLHQAALGSVPRSISDPITFSEVNVNGTLHILVAARDHRIKRFVYASSSSVYGDHPGLPKVETQIGHPLSPYAATKMANEIYAETFACCYGLKVVGLRYFNVFGPRQDPEGAYAAVIPKWIAALLKNEPIYINGDGTTSRDFCYVANVVQVNLLAATVEDEAATNTVYNVALSERTTLNELFRLLRDFLAEGAREPVYREFRQGDVLHSQADISRAVQRLGYAPTHRLKEGLAEALEWYRMNVS